MCHCAHVHRRPSGEDDLVVGHEEWYNGAEVLPADTRTVEFRLAIVVFDRTNLYQSFKTIQCVFGFEL